METPRTSKVRGVSWRQVGGAERSGYRRLMVDIGRLPKDQRIRIAQLQGAASRLGHSQPNDAAAIDELHDISADPFELGVAAGVLDTHDYEPRAAELLHQAGADPDVAAEQAREIRERDARRGGYRT